MFLNENEATFSGEAAAYAGPTALAEIMLESEAAWGNLVRRMIAIEHRAVVTENAQLLTEAKGQFWEKVKAWWNKFVTSIKNFFKKVWDRITSLFMSDEKWIRAHAADLGKVHYASDHDFKVKISKAVYDGSAVNRVKTLADKVIAFPDMADSLDKIAADKKGGSVMDGVKMAFAKHAGISAKSPADFTTALRTFVLGGMDGEPQEQTITSANFQTIFKGIQNLVKVGANVNKLSQAITKMEGKINKAISEGEKSKDENAAKGVEVLRACSELLSLMLSNVSSLITTIRSQSMAVLRGGLNAARSSNGGKIAKPKAESADAGADEGADDKGEFSFASLTEDTEAGTSDDLFADV